MSSIILGTYPVLNSKISSIDQNGIETLSYNYTIKTADSIYYVPQKDTEFYGLTNNFNNPFISDKPADFPAESSSYLVTQISTDEMFGDLTKLTINTIGTKNIDLPATISMLPNYPLIYGLSGTSQVFGSYYAGIKDDTKAIRTIERGGVGIVVTFLDNKGTEQDIYGTYSYKIMPPTIKNANLPVSTIGAFVNSSGTADYYQYLAYNGFICKEITFETYGGIILYRLIFSESGKMTYSFATIVENGVTVQTGSSGIIFDV